MQQQEAEIIALQALAWLAGNDELCPIFLGATGGSTDEMRDRATDPAFQASILEFLRWTMRGSSRFAIVSILAMINRCVPVMRCQEQNRQSGLKGRF